MGHLSAYTPAETDPRGDVTDPTPAQTIHQDVAVAIPAETRAHTEHQLGAGQDQGEEKHAGKGSATQRLAMPGLSPPRDLPQACPPREIECGPRTCLKRDSHTTQIDAQSRKPGRPHNMRSNQSHMQAKKQK